jgi:hypothetical protein
MMSVVAWLRKNDNYNWTLPRYVVHDVVLCISSKNAALASAVTAPGILGGLVAHDARLVC